MSLRQAVRWISSGQQKRKGQRQAEKPVVEDPTLGSRVVGVIVGDGSLLPEIRPQRNYGRIVVKR